MINSLTYLRLNGSKISEYSRTSSVRNTTSSTVSGPTGQSSSLSSPTRLSSCASRDDSKEGPKVVVPVPQ